MIRYLVLGIGDTKFGLSLRMFQFAYLGFLLLLVYFLIGIYRPYKIHRQCADASAKTVLAQQSGDSFGAYQNIYNACMSEASQFPF